LQELKLKRSKTMTYKLNIRRITLGLLPIIALVFAGALAATSQTSAPHNVKNIVLIHGGFVDGSGWEGVYNTLKKKGYNITIVQNPTISLAADVAVTKRVIAAQDGPVILVGHSYGGVVITEAGTDPKVVGLVYVAAFAPDRGESVETLIKNPPPGAPAPPILPAAGRVPLSGPVQVRGLVRRRCKSWFGRFHGRFSGSMGRAGTQRNGERTSVEIQAQLVPRFYGGQNDSSRRSTGHVETRRFKSCRS
jgi:pimeloyl-ACP methyl ester carboxylesterase